MPKVLYNLRLLADAPLRQRQFEIFLDSYGASLDADPYCYNPRTRRGADALWQDFVRVCEDTNRALAKNTSRPLIEND